jgi:hypothetical protein
MEERILSRNRRSCCISIAFNLPIPPSITRVARGRKTNKKAMPFSLNVLDSLSGIDCQGGSAAIGFLGENATQKTETPGEI